MTEYVLYMTEYVLYMTEYMMYKSKELRNNEVKYSQIANCTCSLISAV